MNPILITYFEEIIEIDGFEYASISFSSFFADSLYSTAVSEAVDDGYLYSLDSHSLYKLTEQGKDFMRVIML